MSDKDYSGCEFCVATLAEAHKLCKLEDLYNSQYKIDCKDNPNCLYKQLQAKSDECEELNEDIKKWESVNGVGFTKILKQNITLKQQLDTLKQARDENRCAWKCLEGEFCSEAQQKLKDAVEALEKIISLKAKVIQTYNPLSLLDTLQVKGIAKTALDKIKGK